MKKKFIKFLPNIILSWLKTLKKIQRRKYLYKQKATHKVITKHNLLKDLKLIGLKSGDTVLVHVSFSKIGYVEGGAKTLVDALLEIIGVEGTLLFPVFPAIGRNKTYLEQNPTFDILNTPSQMGIVTEYFRKLPNVFRSFHPTDSVCAFGKNAEYITNTHFGRSTPYDEFSPFRKLCSLKGKILMLGTTLNGACTNLHTLEDAVDFKFPVYDEQLFEVKMANEKGNILTMKTKVHNPHYSAKRNADELLTLFENEMIVSKGNIGEAKSLVIDANRMLEVMIKNYMERGITMYTPYGS